MLTKNETAALTLSPTKKDFVQIWNELLEVAGKLSERWDPTSTNESDPGIVILKALTGIADKLNYNIDKNTLEAFMPTAAQEDSMRKLCDMLGYNIKYYRSAVTDVTIRYYNPDPSEAEKIAIDGGLLLPKFTALTNADNTISYFTINQTPYIINSTTPKLTVECMEGQIVKCESINDNDVIATNQIMDNNRFYLPETHVAENGIFIYNVFSLGNGVLEDGTRWTKVDNLNTQVRGSRVFKFGYDSFEGRPYIEFPEDYSELFESGIFIYYTRTNGVNGNISPRTLTQLELPSLTGWSDVAEESFNVENPFASNTGANIETIGQAYNNFKKTIGTFDTLVTCRDYMNKIYSMLDSDDKPYVSNILVTDIRNDLNRAVTICSCDGAGIFYKEKPLVTVSYDTINKPVFFDGKWYVGSSDGIEITSSQDTSFFIDDATGFDPNSFGTVKAVGQHWVIEQGDKAFTTKLLAKAEASNAIDHFDLVFYPFKTYSQVRSNVKDIKAAYDASFTYNETAIDAVKRELDSEQLRLVAHKIQKPRTGSGTTLGDIVSINNYLRLNALISTNAKLTVDEGTLLVDKVKVALANAFNMRELDFGEEIPFDSILEVIETADSRIRVVSLAEPALYTTFSVLDSYKEDGTPVIIEYGVASDNWLTEAEAEASGRFKSQDKNEVAPLKYFNTNEAKRHYNKLVLRNILAGRVPLFNYNKTFTTSFAEGPYLATKVVPNNPGVPVSPTVAAPITIYTKEDKIYTAQLGVGDDVTYTETYQPQPAQTDGSDTETIKEVKAFCNIPAADGTVRDVKLAQGEYIKFRAPNFITTKTYPAYVNYHLQLNKELDREAVGASGSSLFTLMNADLIKNEQQNIPGFSYASSDKVAWQKAIDYFAAVDYAKYGDPVNDEVFITDPIELAARKKARLVKEFTLTQKISAFSQTDLSASEPIAKNDIIISIPESTAGEKATAVSDLLASCGCMKIKNPLSERYNTTTNPTEGGFVATLAWDTSDAQAYSKVKDKDILPSGYEIAIALTQGGIINPFITSTATFDSIKTEVNQRLEDLRYLTDDSGNPILPTDCAWTISFTFQYVPVNAASLDVWTNFVQDLPTTVEVPDSKPIKVEIPGEADMSLSGRTNKLNFEIDATESVFWRKFGNGYTLGKYIESSNNRGKYLKFSARYFESISGNVTEGLYILHTLGQDAVPTEIMNGAEYELLNGERLYIEYTPSTTTADGTSETLPPVTEQYGPGTIIRPQGFESGIIDSTARNDAGTSFAKQVTFKTDLNSGSEDIGMFSFGANEQLEIRDFARVELSSKTAPALYVYKNFDCEILENWHYNENNKRKYTLKDGEYIFYTDQDKSELAYFTNGTSVELHGSVVIPKFDKIEIASILDTGIKDIPWKYLAFASSAEKVLFQEYQYVTLGAGDKIGELTLINPNQSTTDGTDNGIPAITAEWTLCDQNIIYYLSSAPDNAVKLPPVKLADASGYGSGWEVCSVLELEAAPSSAQTLRRTDKVDTGLIITSVKNGSTTESRIVPTMPPVVDTVGAESNEAYPLSFKTNLKCQANSDTLSINDIYANPKNLSSLQLKVFANNKPSIVQTVTGRVTPYSYTRGEMFDFAKWSGNQIQDKAALETWSFVELDSLKNDGNCDNALLLSANIIPNTYGIACIYVSYTSEHASKTANTWIEVLPGTSHDDFVLINTEENRWVSGTAGTAGEETNLPDKLLLYHGINCLRINRTSKFFIKTSKEAQGTLFFDDIRLVSIQNPTNSAKSATNGLNLAQLQYLPIFEREQELSDAITETAANTVTDTIDRASSKLVATSRMIIENHTSDAMTDLYKVKNKLDKLTAIDTSTLTDKIIQSFNGTTSTNNLSTIIQSKNSLASVSETGKQALSILDRASTVNDVSASLTDLLLDLTNPFSQDVKAVLLARLQNILNDVRNAELSPDTLQDSAFMLLELLGDSSIPVALRTELLTKLKADVEQVGSQEHQLYVGELIESVQSPAAYENNQKVLEAINEIKDSDLLKDPIKALDKVASLERVVGTESAAKLRSAIETLRTRINADTFTGDRTVYGNLLNGLEKILTNYESSVLSNLNLVQDDLAAPAGSNLADFIEDVKTAELQVLINERNRLADVFSKLKAAQAIAYSAVYSSILSKLGGLAPTATGLSKNAAYSDFTDEEAQAMQPAIAKMSVAPQNRHTAKRAKLIADISTIISGITQNNIESVTKAVTGYPVTDDWLLLQLPVIKQDLSAVCEDIRNRLSEHKVDSKPITDTVSSVITAVGTGSVLANQLGALNIATNDPIYALIQRISTVATSNDAEQVKALTDTLRNLVNNVDKALVLIDSRFNVVLAGALNEVVEINANSAVITSIANTLMHATTTVDSSIVEEAVVSAFADEAELHNALTTLTGIADFVVNSDAFSSILQRFIAATSTEATSEQRLASAISGWPTVKSAIQTLIPVEQIITRLTDIRNELVLEENWTLSDLTNLKNSLAEFKATLPPDSLLLPGIRDLEVELSSIDIDMKKLPTILEKTEYIRLTEEQLLRDIRALDVDRDFYYNVQVEDSLAIDLNESSATLNTLMNPLANYSINNINNSFVISKLDIDHLSEGLQLARSSRLS